MKEKDKRNFSISIAGHIIGIHTFHTGVYSLCENYLSCLEPEFDIYVTENDLEFERAEAKKIRISQNDSYLETLVVYRKISEQMLSFDTFLMHGAVVAVDTDAYLFAADSGQGKTTHIKKWLNKVKGAYIVNGDKPLIKITDTQLLVCGTPWSGKEHLDTNTMVPLKAIVLMVRGDNNDMEEISYGQAFVNLLQQTYRPNDGEGIRTTLKLLSQLDGKVRFYRFTFNNMKEDVVDVAYESLTGNKLPKSIEKVEVADNLLYALDSAKSDKDSDRENSACKDEYIKDMLYQAFLKSPKSLEQIIGYMLQKTVDEQNDS